MQTYPFVRLDEAKAAARARGIELIDFGMGDPMESTPEFIQHALAEALPLTELTTPALIRTAVPTLQRNRTQESKPSFFARWGFQSWTSQRKRRTT